MRSLSLIIVAVFICNIANAQKKNSIVFNSYNSAGFVAGKLPIAFAAQTENGIAVNNWFFGAGFGIDNYYKQTLPVYAALKKIFPFKSNGLLLYANIGINIIAKDKSVKTFNGSIHTTNGFYADAGVGYKISAGKRNSVFFSAGNTLKEIGETENTGDFFGMPGIYSAKRKFGRVSLKLGFQF